MWFLKYDTVFTKNGGLNRWTVAGVLFKSSGTKRHKKLHNGQQEKQEIIKKSSEK